MKKLNKKNLTEASKVALFASIMGGAVLSPVIAQETMQTGTKQTQGSSFGEKTKNTSKEHIKIYQKVVLNRMSIAGLDNGHTIFKNAQGEYFYLEPGTGDMKFLSKDYYMKFVTRSSAQSSGRSLNYIKIDGIKGESKFDILGLDNQGNTILQNSKGETFYLDPKTGDMVFVK